MDGASDRSSPSSGCSSFRGCRPCGTCPDTSGSRAGRHGQSLHQAQRHPGVVRILFHSLPPPFRRGSRSALLLGRHGQRFQRVPVFTSQPVPLPVHPLLESRSVLQTEPVQEGTVVKFDGRPVVARPQRLLEPDHVAVEMLRLQPDLVAHRRQQLVAQLPAELVHVGVQTVPGPTLRHLRPESAHQLAAAQGVGWGPDQQGQDRQRVATGRGAACRLALVLEEDAAEELQAGHPSTPGPSRDVRQGQEIPTPSRDDDEGRTGLAKGASRRSDAPGEDGS